jgi:hypothetical protein
VKTLTITLIVGIVLAPSAVKTAATSENSAAILPPQKASRLEVLVSPG